LQGGNVGEGDGAVQQRRDEAASPLRREIPAVLSNELRGRTAAEQRQTRGRTWAPRCAGNDATKPDAPLLERKHKG